MLYQESLWTLVAWLKKMPWELKALNGIYLENYHLFFEDIFGSFVLFFFVCSCFGFIFETGSYITTQAILEYSHNTPQASLNFLAILFL